MLLMRPLVEKIRMEAVPPDSFRTSMSRIAVRPKGNDNKVMTTVAEVNRDLAGPPSIQRREVKSSHAALRSAHSGQTGQARRSTAYVGARLVSNARKRTSGNW